MPEIDIKKWPVLKNLDKEFVINIKCVYVFGINGNEVIILTKDDNVYAFGSNTDGCLGVGHNNAVQQPTLIPELCQKQINTLEFGAKNFVMAIDTHGSIYSWGNNKFGQLCNDNTISQYKPINIESLNGENVIEIKSGKLHSLARMLSGDTYLLGFRYDQNAYKFIASVPTMMTKTNQRKLISISSGLYHALALTDNGDVYYWGDYAKGKIYDEYIDRNISSYNANYFFSSFAWARMENENFNDVFITKIVCGPYHSLMLSKKGNVYCFGANDCAQCCVARGGTRGVPIKVETQLKFIDIGATKNYDISVGLEESGICYVWGKCRENIINKPLATKFQNINEVLDFYSNTKVTYAPIIPSTIHGSVILDRISSNFNERENSDITFKVEDKYIYAQKAHLFNVCKHFKDVISEKNWVENKENNIEIKNYSYSVYYAFIKYLYTECVDIKEEYSIELLKLAYTYLDEELKTECAKIIKNIITTDNVMSIYSSADKYKSNELKQYCVEYITRFNLQNEANSKLILENSLKLSANL